MQKIHYTKLEKGPTATADATDATFPGKNRYVVNPPTQLNRNRSAEDPGDAPSNTQQDHTPRKQHAVAPHGSLCTMFLYWCWGCFVGDVSGVAYDALKMAVEHVLGKIREGKKLSTEDVLVLYLGTIVGDLKEIRADIARLDDKIDKTNQRIDDTVKTLSARIDETNKRIDELARSLSARIDETNKRIDAVQATLLEIQKLLIELVKTRQQ